MEIPKTNKNLCETAHRIVFIPCIFGKYVVSYKCRSRYQKVHLLIAAFLFFYKLVAP